MLPRFARLRKAREFRAVFAARPDARSGSGSGSRRGGRVVSTPLLALHAKPRRSGLGPAGAAALRFGFSISKKVSKRSHDRNRLKRRLSEIARKEALPGYRSADCYDCVVVVRQGAVDADSASLGRDLHSLLRRAGIRVSSAADAGKAGG